MGALTMLNESGDTTLVWSEEQDAAMAEIIAKKMAEGCTFYIIEPRLGGLAAPKRTPLKDFESALAHRAISIPDADLMKFVGIGGAVAVKTPDKPARAARRSKDAKEVAKSESIGVKPRRGG